MKKIVTIAVVLIAGYWLYSQFFVTSGLMKEAGVGAGGAATRQMRKIMRACMKETNEYCTADGGIEGIMVCLADHEDDLSERCIREFEQAP